MHSRKSLLFSNNEISVKKDFDKFDINMRSFDGAELPPANISTSDQHCFNVVNQR